LEGDNLVKLSTIFVDNPKILHETAELASKTYGISVVFEDLDGMRITDLRDTPENEKPFIERYIFCEICKEIYRGRDNTGARFCNVSDRDASWAALAMDLNIPFLFKCHAGLSNFLIPIRIGGSVAGNAFGGQFFIKRDEKNEADDEWVKTTKKLVLDRWEEKHWQIDEKILDGYVNNLEEFLLGPESGGYGISAFIAWRNSKAKNEGSLNEVIPKHLIPVYKTTIYGVSRWELIEELANKIWEENPYPILQSIRKIREDGIQFPKPTRNEVKSFLDVLMERLPENVLDTEIRAPRKLQAFITEYIAAIETYERYKSEHTKPLGSILDIIVKLYSEADTLSRLANERYYLKLYEGVSSHIPEFVANKCKQDLDWIRNNTRELVIGPAGKRSPNISEHKERIQEINRRFFVVLSGIQEYQDELAKRLIGKLGELVVVRQKPPGNLLYRFFDSYRQSVSDSGDVGEEIDRWERVYLTHILDLQSDQTEKRQFEGELRKQENLIFELQGEKFQVERDKSMRQESKDKKLQEIKERTEEANSRVENCKEKLQTLNEAIERINSEKDQLLQWIYECKKLHEDFKEKIESVYDQMDQKIRPAAEETPEVPVYDTFGIVLSSAENWTDIASRIEELEKSRKKLLSVQEEMNNELRTTEKIENASHYNVEKSKDDVSIGIIGSKEWRTNRLVALNDTLAKLMNLFHKKGFHIRYDTIYFNAGGLAPVHTDIELEQEKWLIDRDETGPVSEKTEHRIERELKITRKYLSLLLNVDESEIVLTDSTTEGIFLTLNAINFEKGDQILTTKSEHDVVRYLLQRTKEKHEARGINLNIEEFQKDKLATHVTKATRLVVFSDILFTTGDRLESKRIIDECRQKYDKECAKPNETHSHKSRGILFLIDGAQSVGQTKIDLGDMKCDFFAMDGHKWLLASEGSGALFVKKEHFKEKDDTVKFTFIKNYMVISGKEGHHPKYKGPKNEDHEYELATINLSSKIGLRSAIQILARDGLATLCNGVFGLEEEDRNTMSWKILNDAFNRIGELKEIDIEVNKGFDEWKFKRSPLPQLFAIYRKNGKLYMKTQNTEATQKLIQTCLDKGIAQTRDTIKKLKSHFWKRFGELKQNLDSNVQAKFTVKSATEEGNEGGVVGFQLIRKNAEKGKDQAAGYDVHEGLGKTLQKEHQIIFRVILFPYPPAIRICLHKYNTITEIDLLCYALNKTIPALSSMEQ
jgi:selenocysteine lyase/cysteine desulfurase/ligand-binding sensor protein